MARASAKGMPRDRPRAAVTQDVGWLETEIGNLRTGARRGYTAPKAAVRRVVKQIDALLADPIDLNLFMTPARRDSSST